MDYGTDYREMTLDEYLKEKKEEYLYHKECESFKDRFSKYDDGIKNIVKSEFAKAIYYDVDPFDVAPDLKKLKLEHTKALMCAAILQSAIEIAKKSVETITEVMNDGSQEDN